MVLLEEYIPLVRWSVINAGGGWDCSEDSYNYKLNEILNWLFINVARKVQELILKNVQRILLTVGVMNSEFLNFFLSLNFYFHTCWGVHPPQQSSSMYLMTSFPTFNFQQPQILSECQIWYWLHPFQIFIPFSPKLDYFPAIYLQLVHKK